MLKNQRECTGKYHKKQKTEKYAQWTQCPSYLHLRDLSGVNLIALCMQEKKPHFVKQVFSTT